MATTFLSAIAAGVGAASTTVQATVTVANTGDSIILGVLNRSDESTTISTISDSVNGSWDLGATLLSGPYDDATTTMRTWMYVRHNCTAGSTTVTVTFSGAINSQLAINAAHSDVGVLTNGNVGTVADGDASGYDSNTVAVTGGGAIVGFFAINNSQTDPEPTADGAGESRLTAGAAGARAFLFGEPFTTDGTLGLEATADAGNWNFHVLALLEPAAGDPEGSLIGGKLVGGGLLISGVLVQ